MQIDLDDHSDAYAPDLPSGGLVHGGAFGEDALTAPATTALYLRQINPNLVITGGFVLGGIVALNLLIAGLGKANPNNQMLQTQQVQAEAYKQMVAASSESLKTVANQRPACIAIVCNFPEAPQQPQAQPAEMLPYQQPPMQDVPPRPDLPDYYPDPVVPASLALTIPTDATTVEFWRYWAKDPAYVNTWIAACRSQGGATPECIALYQAF